MIENKAADELISQFESDQLTGTLYFDEKLLELEALIDEADKPRLEKLSTLSCTRIPSGSKEKLQDFVTQYSSLEQQNFYYQSSPVLLNLCRSIALMYLGELQQSEQINQQMLAKAEALGETKLIADAYFTIGQLSLFKSQFLSAIDSMSISFELYQKLGYWNTANINIISLASAYRRLGDNKKALYYYNIVEQHFIENNKLNLLATVEQAMAYIKLDSGDYQESLNYFEKIYQVAVKSGSDLYMAEIAVDMSAPLIKLNRLNEAEKWLDQAKPFIKANNYSHFGYMHTYYLELRLRQEQYEQALVHFIEAKKSFDKYNNKKGLAIAYPVVAELYAQQGDFKSANHWHHKFLTIHNQLDENALATFNSEMRIRFDSKQLEEQQSQLIAFQALKESQLEALSTKQQLQYVAIVLTFILIVILAIFFVKLIFKSIQYKQLALTDPLTQIPNRLFAYKIVKHLFLKGNKFSILLIDVDHFKAVNDNFGHDVGDTALQLIAHKINEICRKEDTLARIGGEEFLVIMPNADDTDAISLASRINQHVKLIDTQALSMPNPFTVSIGIATVTDEKAISPLLKKADIALYQAKNAGRDGYVNYQIALEDEDEDEDEEDLALNLKSSKQEHSQ
ncbi:tetratricopeptide repeat-containing diguanylate cyclase [Shewanella goraebulensis]|uniref:tetratricopeptide repeat-containing diguanylate cyclase n=1 Tax=Shewanella goraebulensis TaxID=3050637 RepID=UPI00254AB76C|nr:GGDEF domain-containing protein [Shewanella goraebulensis]